MLGPLIQVIVSPSLKFLLTLLGFELTAMFRPPLHRFMFVLVYFPLTFLLTAYVSQYSYADEYDVPMWFQIVADIKSFFEVAVHMMWIEWRFGFFSIARSVRRASDLFRHMRRTSGPLLPTYHR